MKLEEAGHKMTDQHFVLLAMNSSTKEYATEVCLMEEKLNPGKDIEIDDLNEWFALPFERKTDYNNEDDSDESVGDEKALFGKEFIGKCHNCGNHGHKGRIVPKEENQDMSSWKMQQLRHSWASWS